MKFLLDTNVFCEIGSAQPNANVASWLGVIDDSDLAMSVLTVREVQKGIVKLRAKKPEVADGLDRRTKEAVTAFGERVLPITPEIAFLWGELLAQSEKHIVDAGLAATARVHNLILVTRNSRDFKGRGVTTFDPFKRTSKTKAA